VSWFSDTLASVSKIFGMEASELDALVDSVTQKATRLVLDVSLKVTQAAVRVVAEAFDRALPGQTFDEIAAEVADEVSSVIADPPLPDVETPVLAEAEKERVRVWAEGNPSMVLEFVARIDDRTSEICRECNGTRLPAGHPWWRTHTPPLHPHCRSTVVQSRGGPITADPPEVEL
jgi:hypothetical protein